ncbi:MAG TPA: threonine ammonia-lyase [Nitrospirota bacterium]|nr:threonine ammonia-lyase [Nitrospirota bacterium]
MITLKDIQEARKNLVPFIHKTPLIYSNSLSNLSGAEVYLKLENLQKTGSFKVRGAFNKMSHVSADRVIAASMGNHAQAVAFAAQKLGKHAQIIMPLTAPIIKEEATRGYGAEVNLVGERFSEALEYALSQKESTFIHPFDDDLVIAGQGTIGVEIYEDLREINAVFVPVGGGGLVAGLAAALKALSPRTAVIGVQAESAPAAALSFKDKKIEDRVPLLTIADGIAVNRPGEKTFELILRCVDDMVLVSEERIAMSILLFLERKKLVVEGAGAAPLAAFMEMKDRYRNQRVVLVVSGGNVDFTIMDRIIRKGLGTSGRIGIIEVTIDDIAGSLHKVTGILAARRANVLDIIHDRLSGGLPYGKAKVIVTVEIRGKQHLDQIIMGLEAEGYEARERAGI